MDQTCHPQRTFVEEGTIIQWGISLLSDLARAIEVLDKPHTKITATTQRTRPP